MSCSVHKFLFIFLFSNEASSGSALIPEREGGQLLMGGKRVKHVHEDCAVMDSSAIKREIDRDGDKLSVYQMSQAGKVNQGETESSQKRRKRVKKNNETPEKEKAEHN